MKGQLKPRGSRLTLAEVRELQGALWDEGGAPRGFSDGSGRHRVGDNIKVRPKGLHGTLSGADLPPYSLVAFDNSTLDAPYDLTDRISVKRVALTTNRLFLLTNAEIDVKSGKQGHFLPVTAWAITWARVTTNASKQPSAGSLCGVVVNDCVVSTEYGGLLCVVDGGLVNYGATTAQKVVGVVPIQNHFWWWATVNSHDAGANTYNVTSPTGNKDVVCTPIPANGSLGTAIANGKTVKVDYNVFDGKYHITEVIGC